VEHARNVAGITEADVEETAPSSPVLVITRLANSLAGIAQDIFVTSDTSVHRAYGKDRATEQFTCSYGLNESYREDIIRGDLRIVGRDTGGNARIVEGRSHPFFVATLFLPQLSSLPGNPHPVILAFIRAALAFQKTRGTAR